jgi:GH35 family endo-1,4-beta-xylanase
VVGHFRGKVRAWDVVNEVIDDNAQFRDTLWYRAFGSDYIEWALRWAHQADPRAKLFVNDYNLEGLSAKTDAYYALVKDLQAKRAPVDGLGVQGHLSLMFGFPFKMPENLQRFAALGLDIAITEADVRIPMPVDGDELQRQASYFRQMLDACLSVRSCHTFRCGASATGTPGCRASSPTRLRARRRRSPRRSSPSRRTSRCAGRSWACRRQEGPARAAACRSARAPLR